MKRPLRWYWVLLLSLGVYCVGGVGVMFLALGWGFPPPGGPLNHVLDSVFSVLRAVIGDGSAGYLLILGLAAVPALPAILLCLWLRRGSRRDDGYLHCLQCGYILKGISEPRCPECGERI